MPQTLKYSRKPFSEPEIKQIADWLNHPAKQFFVDFLLAQQAELEIQANELHKKYVSGLGGNNNIIDDAGSAMSEAIVLEGAIEHLQHDYQPEDFFKLEVGIYG